MSKNLKRIISEHKVTTDCDPLYAFPPSPTSPTHQCPSVTTLKRQFHILYEKNLENKVTEKKANTLRIATFNIHYWTDLYDKSSVDKLINDITLINADLICLQEVSFDQTKYNPYNYEQLMKTFKRLGYQDSVEVYGSQYLGGRFGN